MRREGGVVSDTAVPARSVFSNMLGIWPVLAGIAVFVFSTVTWVANEKSATDQNAADIAQLRTLDAQNLSDLKLSFNQTIADMNSNQLPKRVQILEDNFAAAQIAAQAQSQATQTALLALQQAFQTSSRDIQTQLNGQAVSLAALVARSQYWGLPPAPAHP